MTDYDALLRLAHERAIAFLASLPKSSTLKILRRELRAMSVPGGSPS